MALLHLCASLGELGLGLQLALSRVSNCNLNPNPKGAGGLQKYNSTKKKLDFDLASNGAMA